MKLAVPRELQPGESRVALVPESVKRLVAAGFRVLVEPGAGERAHFGDAAYREAGAAIVPDAGELLGDADMVVKVGPPAVGAGATGREPARHEVSLLRPEGMLLASLMPTRNLGAVRALAARGVTSFSTDTIPRTTRAQAMDTLSSMANISGYRGAMIGAMELGKYAPMLMTAAGTVLPARFFVIGAGVAGLQAIATARRLGATVVATDVRPEVKEQIESVGAKYVGAALSGSASAGGGYAGALSEDDRQRQAEVLAEECARADVVITTALIGGVVAPRLITRGMVARMRPGSVIVDLAAEGGGNCELSVIGGTTEVNGVRIVAPTNLPATMPVHASLLWSRNLTAFLLAFWREGRFHVDPSDEILRGALITHRGEVVHPRVREALTGAETPSPGAAAAIT
jgi:NAD(P) transhydrogenase subunit alpha